MFRNLLKELEKLERFCKAEADGARVVERAAGVLETLSEMGVRRLPKTTEQAHLTGVTFSAAAHIASEWEYAAQDARKLRMRLETLKMADRREQIGIANQLKEFTTTFFEEAGKRIAEGRGSSGGGGQKS